MTSYDQDVIAWAREQAALLRTGRFEEIDVGHIADEIEDVARAEVRDMARRMRALPCGFSGGSTSRSSARRACVR
ncbi:hypothetical protein BN2476_990049 [Paraburkholderia piptadeniae]|uniref:DUF29 domain-containing protein n=1 Tax=Paraburkholderia piptadeniae TaxID=1701573 RepID=A0A1N7SVV9_9BURK|nr:hypothetical protein BN2476_990049 [Paraburkholderia piptadeniae]